ncbi:hypothetical protein C818_01802 [Lachnospiraceae bacterium MD308]|nr:hypothetical protein C818_01802 [Lachnospiraceae bacterium MD308]
MSKQYVASLIIVNIRDSFVDNYPNAKSFSETRLFQDCLKCMSTDNNLQKIVTENDNGTPPVQTLLKLFKQNELCIEKEAFYNHQCLGELMAFVFKKCLHYTEQKSNIPVKNDFGINSATLYLGCEKIEIVN